MKTFETPPSPDFDVTQAKCSPAKERGERHQETVETGFIWLNFQVNLLALPVWPDEDDGKEGGEAGGDGKVEKLGKKI